MWCLVRFYRYRRSINRLTHKGGSPLVKASLRENGMVNLSYISFFQVGQQKTARLIQFSYDEALKVWKSPMS